MGRLVVVEFEVEFEWDRVVLVFCRGAAEIGEMPNVFDSHEELKVILKPLANVTVRFPLKLLSICNVFSLLFAGTPSSPFASFCVID